MSAGSDASILGYGSQSPFHNVNPAFVNASSTNYSGNFSSNEIPGLPGLSGAKNNVDAAAGILKGGKRKKNISHYYKQMKRSHRRSRSRSHRHTRTRRSSRSRISRSRSFAGGRRRHRRMSQRGGDGYAQYQNNMPISSGYSTAGTYLSPNNSALASPPPYTPQNNSVDNYNHYTNTGFPSRGH